jgi:hypothetical protein
MEECRQRRRRWQRRRCRRVPCVVGEAAANRPGTSHTLEAKYVPRAIPLLTRLLGLSLLVALAALLALACLGLALACLDLRLLDRLGSQGCLVLLTLLLCGGSVRPARGGVADPHHARCGRVPVRAQVALPACAAAVGAHKVIL